MAETDDWVDVQSDDQLTTGATPAADDGWEDVPTQAAAAPATEDGWEDVPAGPTSSTGGAVLRQAAHGAITAVGSLPAIATGAEVGGALGLLGGPAAPFTVPAGAILGGVGGALIGGHYMNKFKNWGLEQLGLRQGEGFFSEAQEQADIAQHPTASLVGNLGGGAVAFGTNLQAKLAEKVLGGGIMAALEGGHEYAETGKIDPLHVGIAGAFGAVMNRPRPFAEKIMGASTAATQRVTAPFKPGRPDQAPKPVPDIDRQVPADEPTLNEAARETPTDPMRWDEGFDSAGMMQDKADAVRSPPQTVARGVAAEMPPPVEPSRPIGNNIGERSEREYPKAEQERVQPSFGDMDPTTMAALEQSTNKGALTEARPPEPKDQGPPYPTGLVEAAKAAEVKPPITEADVEAHVKKTGLIPEQARQELEIKARQPDNVKTTSKAKLKTETEIRRKPVEEEMVGERDAGDFGEAAIAAEQKKGVKPDYEEAATQRAQEIVDDALTTGKLTLPKGKTRDEAVEFAKKAIIDKHMAEEATRPPVGPKAQAAVEISRAKAEPVTATVKPSVTPKIVTKAVEEMQRRGAAKEVVEGFQKLPAERQVVEADKYLRGVASKTGVLPTEAQKTVRLRNPEVKKNLEIDGTGKEAGTVGEAKIKTHAIDSMTAAMKKHPPVEGETREAMRVRLARAWQDVINANGGKDPIFRMQAPPRELMWAKAVRDFLKTRKPSTLRHDEMIANERLLHGNEEAVQAYRDENRIAGDIAYSRRSGEAAIMEAEGQRAREFTGERLDAEEPGLPVREEPATQESIKRDAERLRKAPLDLGKIEPKQLEQFGRDQEAVERNLIAAVDKAEISQAAMRKAEAAKLAGKQGEPAKNTEEYAAANKGKSLPLDEATLQWAKESIAKAEAKKKSQAVPEPSAAPIPEGRTIKDLTDAFLETSTRFRDNESGGLNVKKVAETYRVMEKSIRNGLEKYFGVPMTDVAKIVSQQMGKMVSNVSALSAEKAKTLEARWLSWATGANKTEATTYLKTLETFDSNKKIETLVQQGTPRAAAETQVKAAFAVELERAGIPPAKTKWMADELLFHRQLLDQIFVDDAKYGSKADYRDMYITHLFKDKHQKAAMDFIEQRIKNLGATWYQKERMFDLIKQAEAKGFELRYTNPIDLISARWAASINSNMVVGVLRELEKIGLAHPVSSATPAAKQAKANWEASPINAPDRQQWLVHPEGRQIFDNATQTRGIANMGNMWGSAYQTWMKIKTVWMPLELFFSGFHELHIVANINPAQNMTRAIRLSMKDGEWTKNFMDAAKHTIKDPFSQGFKGSEGRQVMDWWSTPDKDLTPSQLFIKNTLKEMGVSPNQPHEDVIGAKNAFASALANREYVKLIPASLRRGIEVVQDPMFKYQIPALKVVAALRDAAAAVKMDPTLAHDSVKRGQVYREIGKNIDDRFGEMFYKGLFWNKYLKDAGIASMLSMSWNLGQVRQAGGAVQNLVKSGLQAAGGEKRTRLQQAIFNGTDKGTFVTTYIGMSMATAGAISWAMSGQFPTGLDYFFPKNGLKNPDGSPGRLTTPFNTREAPMLVGHAQERGSGPMGYLGGSLSLLWNKMILSPLTDAWSNRDFFGHKLFDSNAPWYKQAYQLIDSTLGAHTSPISVSGAQRAKEQGGGVLHQALAYAGFGPAPKYVSSTAIENRITHLFNEEGTPHSKPYEYGEKTGAGRGLVQGAVRYFAGDKLKTEARQEGRAELNLARQAGESDAAFQARRKLILEGGMSKQTVKKLNPQEEFEYKFARLPLDTQKALVRDMGPEDFSRFVMKNHLITSKTTRFELMKGRTNP